MAWVTKDSTETYNQTPEPPRERLKRPPTGGTTIGLLL